MKPSCPDQIDGKQNTMVCSCFRMICPMNICAVSPVSYTHLSHLFEQAGTVDDRGIWGEGVRPEEPGTDDYLKYSPYIHPTVIDVYKRQRFSVPQSCACFPVQSRQLSYLSLIHIYMVTLPTKKHLTDP